ncbi:Uncharacterised protein [Vibrio cholerae]|nr:Uncharacterised protein [Vibrio cholerae]CSI60280.1 Uncharacterised protein [Vibrio cholerae]
MVLRLIGDTFAKRYRSLVWFSGDSLESRCSIFTYQCSIGHNTRMQPHVVLAHDAQEP